MKIRCAILEDEDISRKMLVQAVGKIEDLELLGEFDSPLKALSFLAKNPVDLLISDIEMPDMSGLELLQSLSYKPRVIFISAHENYAARAFDVDVTDYVVKPLSLPRLLKAVGKVREQLESKSGRPAPAEDFLFVRKNQSMVKVDFTDILWIQADADYMLIQTEKESFMHLSTMKALESALPLTDFVRVHRSYIVRIDKINAIEDMMIVINRKAIPISSSYWEPLKKRLNIA